MSRSACWGASLAVLRLGMFCLAFLACASAHAQAAGSSTEPGFPPEPALAGDPAATPPGPRPLAPATDDSEPETPGLSGESVARARQRTESFLASPDSPKSELPISELQDLLQVSSERWRELEDMKAELVKQERIHGKLHPEERILIKYRKLQNSLYMKWLRGEGGKKGSELLFAEHLNQGRLIMAAAGWLIFAPQITSLDPTSESALEGTLYPHTEYHIGATMERFLSDWRRALASPDGRDLLGVRYRGLKRLGKGLPQTHVFDVWFRPVDRLGQPYGSGRVVLGFDPESLLIMAFESYRTSEGDRVSEQNLLARYQYTRLEIDPHLSAEDFSPTNPGYQFNSR